VIEERDLDADTADVVVDSAEGIGEEDSKEIGGGFGAAVPA